MEARAERAEAERKAAKDGLEQHKAQVAPTRAKIEALGQRFVSLQDSHSRLEAALRRSEQLRASESRSKEALEPRLKTAEDRIKELEVRLCPDACFPLLYLWMPEFHILNFHRPECSYGLKTLKAFLDHSANSACFLSFENILYIPKIPKKCTC